MNRKEQMFRERFTLCNIIGFIIIFVVMIIMFIYNLTSTGSLSSDMSSEMVLADFLSKRGWWGLSEDWFYSTELRVFNTQIVMMLLFRIFHDYSLIRALGNSILWIGLLASGFFMLKQMGISKGKIVLPLALLILPFSDYQWLIMLIGGYYIPHVTLCFLVLGCLFKVLHNKKGRMVWKILLCLIALIAGLGGVRYLLIIFIPLCFAGAWGILETLKKGEIQKNIFSDFGYIILITFFAGMGYIVYSYILPHFYTFDSYQQVAFIDLLKADNNIVQRGGSIVGGVLKGGIGFFCGAPIFSMNGISNLCIFAVILILIRCFVYIWKRSTKYKLYLRYLICAVIWNGLIFLFTDASFSLGIFSDRYYDLVLIPVFLIMAVYDEVMEEGMYKYILYFMFVVSLVFMSVSHMRTYFKNDLNVHRNGSLEYLEESDLKFGYATYWNANILTEMSDGKIAMASVYGFDDMAAFNYLCPKSYYEKDYSNEPCFILATKEEYGNYSESIVIRNGKKVFEDEYFVILSYPNSETIYNMVNKE